mgnify:CR=1 FL=1
MPQFMSMHSSFPKPPHDAIPTSVAPAAPAAPAAAPTAPHKDAPSASVAKSTNSAAGAGRRAELNNAERAAASSSLPPPAIELKEKAAGAAPPAAAALQQPTACQLPSEQPGELSPSFQLHLTHACDGRCSGCGVCCIGARADRLWLPGWPLAHQEGESLVLINFCVFRFSGHSAQIRSLSSS